MIERVLANQRHITQWLFVFFLRTKTNRGVNKNIHNYFCPKTIFADFQYVKLDKIALLTVPNSSLSEFCPRRPILGANFTSLIEVLAIGNLIGICGSYL